jgi:hypothetical protein
MKITIDPAGNIPIPRELLEKVHLVPGTDVEVDAVRNEIRIKALPDDPNLIYEDGVLVYSGEGLPHGVDLAAQDREERIQELIRRLDGKNE